LTRIVKGPTTGTTASNRAKWITKLGSIVIAQPLAQPISQLVSESLARSVEREKAPSKALRSFPSEIAAPSASPGVSPSCYSTARVSARPNGSLGATTRRRHLVSDMFPSTALDSPLGRMGR
jgi:hypothetical protein